MKTSKYRLVFLTDFRPSPEEKVDSQFNCMEYFFAQHFRSNLDIPFCLLLLMDVELFTVYPLKTNPVIRYLTIRNSQLTGSFFLYIFSDFEKFFFVRLRTIILITK